MSHGAILDDLNFSAFMSSKICHDLVGPVGAISNGLELLEEETDEQTRAYALELIQFSANVARNRLEFARLAFGASSALGSDVELEVVEKIARGFVEEGKHKLHWSSYRGYLDKTCVRFVLTMIMISMTSVPAGGDIFVKLTGDKDVPELEIRCTGRGARIPQEIASMLMGNTDDINPRSIIDYYALRLAETCRMPLTVRKDEDDIVFSAKTLR
ncbi:MAG: hypothetical protein KTR19_13210 [Hyphomicrobiales bacterium]|nr:hypothetical protein [Hyphomicrobiales bacterium]